MPDGNPHRASLSAWINGVLLGSVPMADEGATHLDVRVPDGMVHSLNGIEVRVTREQNSDCGDIPRGFPAQLLGTSEVLLGDAGKLEAFHDFAAASGQGLTVVVPDASALPLALTHVMSPALSTRRVNSSRSRSSSSTMPTLSFMDLSTDHHYDAAVGRRH